METNDDSLAGRIEEFYCTFITDKLPIFIWHSLGCLMKFYFFEMYNK